MKKVARKNENEMETKIIAGKTSFCQLPQWLINLKQSDRAGKQLH